MESHIYVAIDLKSFYASVECKDMGLDPMITNLPYRKNNMPCSFPVPESLWDSGKSKAF